MKEDQIQIRFIPQLNAPQLAITENDKARRLHTSTLGLTILLAEMLPDNGQGLLNNHLGDPSQIVTNLH